MNYVPPEFLSVCRNLKNNDGVFPPSLTTQRQASRACPPQIPILAARSVPLLHPASPLSHWRGEGPLLPPALRRRLDFPALAETDAA